MARGPLVFKGQTEALCMDDTFYDLVFGNIDGSKVPDVSHVSHFSVGVVTRTQAKQDKKAYKKLKVPNQILSENKHAYQDAQMSDLKLEHIWHRADSGVITKSRGLNRGETKIVKRSTCCIDNLLREISRRLNLLSQVVLEKRF